MPVVKLEILDKLTIDQKREIVKEFTKTLEKIAKKPPEYTYVIIQEIDRQNWGHKGKLFSDK